MRRLVPALLLTLLAAACTGAPAPAADPEALTGTLVLQAAGGEGELNALRELVTAYEAVRPGVDVELVGVPDQGDHIAKLATAFAGGRPPDVFLLNYRRLGPFVDRGVLAPPKVVPEGLYPQAVEAFTYDGAPACLPQNVSSSVVYVNTALLAAAGVPLPAAEWTWEELRAAAQRLHAAGTAAVGFAPQLRTLAPFTWTAGGEVVDDLADPTRTTFDTPEGRRAMAFLSDLQRFGYDATSRAAQEPAEAFEAGALALFVDSRRSVPAFRKAEGLAFDVRPLPRAEAGTPSRSLLASDAYCVSKASRTPALAADFAQYAVAGEGGAVLAASGRTVPALRSLAESDAFLAPELEPASAQVFLDVVPDLERLPNIAAQDPAEEAADDLLEQFFAGRIPLADAARRVDEATAAVYVADR